MRRFWAVTFGAPGESQIGIMATPISEGRVSAGKPEYGSEKRCASSILKKPLGDSGRKQISSTSRNT